ncbi:restriction endonuclease subunit S [Mesorhizobium carmichaelinearum]|uniref:restriction endonuclease subunit S n=1 Tax=Mesorhizobium carmichaelinearum TaxID=1208188 RepID=UPI0015C9CEBC|nr:restriction endonuclease subunit S [Mesorhizobium carmichaelinearum]
MSNLPAGWIEATLAEACVLITDGTHHSPENTFEGEFKYITAKNIKRWGLDLGKITYVDAKTHAEIYRRCPPVKGDVLYIKDGATTGIAVVNPLDEPFSMLSSVALLRPHPTLATSEFLCNFLNSPEVYAQMTGDMTGSAIRRLTLSIIARQPISIPPLPEQQRIVGKIDSLTGKSRRARDHLDHIPRLVEKYKQAVLAAAFRGDLLPQPIVADPAPLGDFIKSLDQGWSPKCESDAAGPDEWAVMKTTAIQPIHFLPQENKRLPADFTPRPGITVRKGDVLITRAGPRSRVAISCVVTTDHPRLMLCDKAYRLRVDQAKTDPVFLTYMLNAPQCLGLLEEMKTGISDSGLNLTQGKFLALPIPAFSKIDQLEIVDRIRTALTWIDRLASEATSARRLIDHLDQSVLAKAFSGELVPQDPGDEPASVLLERIRERGTAPKAEKRGRRAKADA